MKQQQLFHSFWQSIAVAVLATQPAISSETPRTSAIDLNNPDAAANIATPNQGDRIVQTTPATSPTVPSSPSTDIRQQVPVPNYLNPNPNPLQFPTKPEEVQIAGTQPITLQQALELARRNNRQLQLAQLNLQRSRDAVAEAQAALLPTFGIGSALSRSQDAGTQLSNELQNRARQPGTPEIQEPSPPTTFTGNAELSYDIFTSGQRTASIRVAEEQARLNQLEVERLAEEVRLNVATNYYNLQAADEQVRINQSAVTNAQASLRDTQALEQAGVGTRFDVLQAQVQLANAVQELTNASSQQEIARRQLAALLSLSQSVNLTAADPVEIAGLWNLSLPESIVQAYQNRAELQQQLIQRNIGAAQRRLALSQLGPRVSVAATYNVLDVFNDQVGVTDGVSLGANVSVNLFDGGAARARARQAETDVAIAETNFAEQRNQIRLEVEEAYNTLQSNLSNIQTASVALEQARESLRLARLRFQAGVGTQTEVINAENALTNAEGNRVTAILEYNRALARLQRAISSGQSQ